VKRLDVARLAAGGREPLGRPGWSVRLIEYQPNYRRPGDANPSDPALSFELASADGRSVRLVTTARPAGVLFPLGEPRPLPPARAVLGVWSPPPAARFADASRRGLLQLASTADGGLWFRSFAGLASGFDFESAGAAGEGAWQRVWSGMGWRFRVAEHLPR